MKNLINYYEKLIIEAYKDGRQYVNDNIDYVLDELWEDTRLTYEEIEELNEFGLNHKYD